MLVYEFDRNSYGVFKVEDQRVEFCPLFSNDGRYKGISVIICSKDKMNFRTYPVLGYGAVIFDEDVEMDENTKEFDIETAVDICRLTIHFGSSINIEYDCRKK